MPGNLLKKLLEEQASDLRDELNIPRLYARDAMTKPLVFRANDPIKKVVEKLKREDYDVCVVVDEEKRFLGEIDDEDLVRIMAYSALKEPITRLLDRAYNKGFAGLKAGDLARHHKNIVAENTPINEVLKKIYRKRHQNIIVVNKDEKVTGIITLSSLMRLLSKY